MKRTRAIKKINAGEFIRNNAKVLFAGVVFLLTYIPTFIWMWDRWMARDSYYSHGILIPFVSAFLIWQKRDELSKVEIKRSAWGLPIIIAGIFGHIVSSLFRVYFSSGFSSLAVLSGLVLFFYGWKIFRKILFPIVFLVFMVPVPLVVITNVSFRMKIFAAEISTMMLNKMGIPALREGSLILMRHAHVIVDDVCSGLRSLISLTALGSIFAYWMNSTKIKKVLLFASTVPIAIITNVIRIIFLSSVAEIWGPKYAQGFVHDASGFMVFGVAFILLYGVGRLLE